ncbi:MAG TPA: amidase family protein, partial [Niallia sp.]|nr:amidase family protein [Niallia sp.]
MPPILEKFPIKYLLDSIDHGTFISFKEEIHIQYRSLREMSEAIHRQQLTPKELLDYYLDNIDKLEKDISAWAYFDKPLAIELAEEYTVEASEKRFRGPLHGIPIGVKDNMDVKGMPTRV